MITIPGKIPVRIHPFFWMTAILLGWMIQSTPQGLLLWVGIILISVLFHEYGHALSAMLFGQSSQIDLIGFGGITSRTGPKLKNWQEFIIIACGPLMGLFLCLLVFFIKQAFPVATAPFGWLLNTVIRVNLFWSFFNLLPIFPLDGGHLLRVTLQAFFGLKGLKACFIISMILAGAFACLAFFNMNLLVTSFFLLFAYDSYRNWQFHSLYSPADEDTKWQNLYREAENDLNLGLRQTALDKFAAIKEGAGSGKIYMSAIARMGEIYAYQGAYSEAFDLLYPLREHLDDPSIYLLQKICYKLEYYDKAVKLGNKLFSTHDNFETAFFNAQCNALVGDKKATLGWIKYAIKAGLPNIQEHLKHPDFNSLRNDPDFKAISS